MTTEQHVYIIGFKGIPARYGGFETFVDKLTAGKGNQHIQYHVAARRDNSEYGQQGERFVYNDADVYNIDVPNIGPAQAIAYDIKAMRSAIAHAKKNQYENPIFYVLASRIGPFMGKLSEQIHRIGGQYFLNPDGNEWKRAKWSAPVRAYWKYSEKLMVRYADLIICDNRKIEEYIQNEYTIYKPNTTFIAYGTDVIPSGLTQNSESVKKWFAEKKITENQYYLIVGRFVPENNYETMIREFMSSNSTKDLVIVTNVEKNKFYQYLSQKTGFENDERIKFVGTVYDQPMLRYIRENAYAYLHGHEVGGTNPSLLEALSSTQLNLLVDVGFNRDVAHEAALYWSKDNGKLAHIINQADSFTTEQLTDNEKKAKQIIGNEYTWEKIIKTYENTFSKN